MDRYRKRRSIPRGAICFVMAALFAWSCAGFGTGLGTHGSAGAPREEREDLPVFEGTGRGFRGPITVAVQLDGETLLGIEILYHEEDPFIGGSAMEELLELALDGNTTDLDAISGATESSLGFLTALEDAMRRGRE